MRLNAYGKKPRVSAQGLEMNERRTEREDSIVE